jgi:thiosulfate reductase cytochrome b subunit
VKRPQPLLIRITHWVNVPVLIVLAMSGLQILSAYPFFGPRGEDWTWVPLRGWVIPDVLRAGSHLAGARHLHFLFAWIFVGNAVFYVVYLFASGAYKERLFWPPRDTKPMFQQLAVYLRIRKEPPASGFYASEPPGEQVPLGYNGLQRNAYTACLVLALLEVLSGFAMWKPVQLWWLAAIFGGYQGARVVHWLALLALVAFAVVHVVMVLLHRKAIVEMVTGGKPR